jgi:hypothetical protein
MNGLKWGYVLAAAILVGYSQYRYAKANYPKNARWKIILFVCGFISGTLGVWALFPMSGLSEILVGALSGGIPLGLIAVFWLPVKSRTIIQEDRDKSNGD